MRLSNCLKTRRVLPAAALLLLVATASAQDAAWVLNNAKDAIQSRGKVGIGPIAPLHQLQITGGPRWTLGNWGGAVGLENGAAIGWPANNAGQRFGLGHTNGGFFMFRTNSDLGLKVGPAIVDLMVNDAGLVGIGTTAPAGNLHVFNPAVSVTSVIETGGGVNAWSKLRFKNARGQWDIGTSHTFHGDNFFVDRLGSDRIELELTPDGNLGLGVNPAARLHLFDPASVSQRIQTGGATNAWARLEFVNGNGQWNVGTSRAFQGDAFYFARQGSTDLAFLIQPTGDVFVNRNLSARSVTVRGGADLAEPFVMDEPKLATGSVVVIDEEHPGRLKCSTSAYDTRVAGIVSGANGVHPGISLRQEGALDEGQDVALSGRVYVLADATTASIRPGDRLTTSSLRGHAMKVSDAARANGAVIGKAMSSLNQGTGLVLVLVTLQ